MYVLGQKLLELIEIIHRAGYIHNNISLDSIALGVGQKIMIEKKDTTANYLVNTHLCIIDYSYLTPFIDRSSGIHLRQEKVNTFNNMSNEF